MFRMQEVLRQAGVPFPGTIKETTYAEETDDKKKKKLARKPKRLTRQSVTAAVFEPVIVKGTTL